MHFSKIYTLVIILSGFFGSLQAQTNPDSILAPVEVRAVTASYKNPFTKTIIKKDALLALNNTQDIPFVLNNTPSVTVSSDAGTGVGYTSMRIRGTDGTRINVTLNGVPYNDAESQGTFFVDIPDVLSSTTDVQIQRGVGTSTNGAGAFGASVHLNMNMLDDSAYLQFQGLAGSFQTFKSALVYNSGKIKNNWYVNLRASYITSDGYVDRASANLFSTFASIAYKTSTTTVKFNWLLGKEKTYQAWNGVDEVTLDTNRRYNSAGTEKPGTPYKNEIDNYTQNHFQLFITQKITSKTYVNVTPFCVLGKGYYEQYKAGVSLTKYGLNAIDTSTSDIVRRLWLQNVFTGVTYSFQHQTKKLDWLYGGMLAYYYGQHFGNVIWASVPVTNTLPKEFYRMPAYKWDINNFIKLTYNINNQWYVYGDVQYRYVDYTIKGFRNNPTIYATNQYNFLNPKLGITFIPDSRQKIYVSYAKATKEPNRDDFEAGIQNQPKPEELHNVEMGYEYHTQQATVSTNLYYMKYRDQLVLNGRINDVGAYTRVNVPNSYRAGLEVSGMYVWSKKVQAETNIAFSTNKIKQYDDYVDEYTDTSFSQIKTSYKNTTISFSPACVAAYTLTYKPIKNFEINIIGKYVSKQYLDNTQQENKILKPYYTQDVRLNFNTKLSAKVDANFFVLANNLFQKYYNSNGYTYSYYENYTVRKLVVNNFYFPMAPFILTVGMHLTLR